MNDVLSKLEEMDEKDLAYIFEYLIDLMNRKKEEKRRQSGKEKNDS